MKVYVVITVTMVMLLKGFGSYRIIFVDILFTALDFTVSFDGLFTGSG
jgi:hypothetical protein